MADQGGGTDRSGSSKAGPPAGGAARRVAGQRRAVPSGVPDDGVPRWLRTSAGITWRLLVLLAGIALVFFATSQVQLLFVAVFIAFVMAAVLRPVVDVYAKVMPRGLATALGFEATLPWLVERDTPDLNETARAIGLSGAAQLPAFVSGLMDRCGVVRALPNAFEAFSARDLAAEMRAAENQPMRRSTIREVTDADIDAFAAAMMALPKTL